MKRLYIFLAILTVCVVSYFGYRAIRSAFTPYSPTLEIQAPNMEIHQIALVASSRTLKMARTVNPELNSSNLVWIIKEKKAAGDHLGLPVILFKGRLVPSYTLANSVTSKTFIPKGYNAVRLDQVLEHEFLHVLVNGSLGIEEWHPAEYDCGVFRWTGNEPFAQ